MSSLFFILVVGCQPKIAQKKASLPQAKSKSTEIESPPKDIVSPFVGHWISVSCDNRTYKRTVNIKKDSTITVQDHISPCPPKASCLWSGIITAKGTWTSKGDGINIKYSTITPDTQHGEEFPHSLQWDRFTLSEEDDARCMYTAQATETVK